MSAGDQPSSPLRPLPRPEPEDVEAAERPAYERVMERQRRLWQGAPSNSDLYFGSLLNSPALAEAQAELGRFMRMGEVRGTYSAADRELVDMVLGVELGYNAIVLLHIPDAISVGVRLEAIEAIWGRAEEGLSAAERQLADYVRAVVRGEVGDDDFAAMLERFGRRTTVEYTAFIAFLLSTFRLWQALGIPDVAGAEIDELLAAYRDGGGPRVDPEARIG